MAEKSKRTSKSSPAKVSAAKVSPGRAGASAAAERRRQAAEALREQQRKQRRNRLVAQLAIGASVALLVVGGLFFWLNRGPSGPVASPEAATADYGFVVGDPAAEVTVEVYEDYQCPHCRELEETQGAQLAEYAAGDQVNVEYRGIAFLDRASTTDYSTRALNASACVMDQGEQVWQRFHGLLFANQPAEGSDGLSDADLADLAEQAGADPAEVQPCLEDGTYEEWADAATRAAEDAGVTATPTVRVDGETIDPADLDSAVQAALSG